jgi:hypothetical protein
MLSETRLAAIAALLLALEEVRRIEVARSTAGQGYLHLQLTHDLVQDIRTLVKEGAKS